METERDMYATTYRTFKDSIGFFLVMAVGVKLIELFVSDAGGIGANVIIFGMVAMFSHRIVMYDETFHAFKNMQTAGRTLPFWSFIWRYGALTLFFALCVFVCVLAAIVAFGQSEQFAFAFALVVSLPLMGFALAKWGTGFPALIASGDTSMKEAACRSRGRIGQIYVKLILGPSAVSILFTLLYIALDALPDQAGSQVITGVSSKLLAFVPTHMTALILSQEYQAAMERSSD